MIASCALRISKAALENTIRRALLPSRWLIDEPDGSLVVTDCWMHSEEHPPEPFRRAVGIVAPDAVSCALALKHLAAGRIHGAACTDELADLSPVLDAVSAGAVALTPQVLPRSSQVPMLSSRQIAIVGELLSGGTNIEIGRRLNFSEATVKRELASIAAVMQVSSRASLISAARASGYTPSPPVRRLLTAGAAS